MDNYFFSGTFPMKGDTEANETVKENPTNNTPMYVAWQQVDKS